LLKMHDAPDGGAINVTLTPEIELPAASSTVTSRGFPNAVLISVDCGVVPGLAIMLAGTCTTGILTVPLVAEALAPPPDAVAAFVTVGLRAYAGTLTPILITLNDAPPDTPAVLVHVTAFVPEQDQPVPLNDVAVNPVGKVSVTVVVPEVVLDAPPVFDTVTVSVPPVCPCVNVPLYPSLTPSTGVDELTVTGTITVWSSTMTVIRAVPADDGANTVLFAPVVMFPCAGPRLPDTPLSEYATGMPSGTKMPPAVVSVIVVPSEALVRFIRIADVAGRVMDDGTAEALSTSQGDVVTSPYTCDEGSSFVPHQLLAAVSVEPSQWIAGAEFPYNRENRIVIPPITS
jgi:hypothetical protein